MQDSLARAASAAIRQQVDSTARGVVERLYAAHPDTPLQCGTESHAKSVRDVGYHLRYLAEALWADDVRLFVNYTAWVAELFSNLGFSPSILSETLVEMQMELYGRVHPTQVEIIDHFLDAAQAFLSAPPLTSNTAREELPHNELSETYLDLLLKAERHQAVSLVLNAVKGGVSIEDIYLHVFQRTQHQIGLLWQRNQISVAQEHYATAATQFAMAQLYPYIFAAPRCGRRLVATSVGNELHELGVRMVADFFETAGWDTYYLGANTPTESVVKAVIDYGADVLAISATLMLHLPHVVELTSAVRQLPARPLILVGGYPFNLSPTLWKKVGADGTAQDARHAVQVAEQLLL